MQTYNNISDDDLEKMRNGIELDDEKTKSCKIKRLSKNKFSIILEEGRNRQIRRMLEKLNQKVKDLKRIRIKNIELGDLGEGKIRILTKKETDILKQ